MKKLLCYLSVFTILGMNGIVHASSDSTDQSAGTEHQLNINNKDNTQLTDDSDVPASYDEDSTTIDQNKDSAGDSSSANNTTSPSDSTTDNSTTTTQSSDTPTSSTLQESTEDDDSGDMRKNGNNGNSGYDNSH